MVNTAGRYDHALDLFLCLLQTSIGLYQERDIGALVLNSQAC